MEDKNKIEIVSDGTRLMSYAEHERIRKNQKIGIGLAVILVAFSLFLAFWNRNFNAYEELRYTQNTEGNGTRYEAYMEGFLKYSKDGISYLNQKDAVQWTAAYTMSKPEAVVQGEYAAVADMEGNAVQLYDRTGKIGEYSMSYPIKKIMVAKQGVFGVVLDAQKEHYIRLYNTDGELLAEIRTKIENNGYPMAVALSEDGVRLVASYYRVDGIDSQNILSFYNFGEGGKGQSGNLVGTIQLDNMLVPKLAFTDKDTVYAVGDSKMLVYDVKNKPKQIREITYPVDIINVFSNESYVGFTCENPVELVEAGKKSPYEIYVYGKTGRQVKHFGTDKIYDEIKIIDNIITCYTGNQCYMVRTNSQDVFQGDMGKNIVDILPTEKRTEFLVVYSESSARIRLINRVVTAEAEEVENVQ